MKLNELPRILACSKATKRRGKGVGSGNGKTAGRGHKGGKARSGYSPAPCCSGIPFYRHLPIRGFSNFKFATVYDIVDLGQLVLLEVDNVDKTAMFRAGLIKKETNLVKILGNATLNKPMTVVADKFSKSAAASIEAVGGKAVALFGRQE